MPGSTIQAKMSHVIIAETERLVMLHVQGGDGDAMDRVFGDAEVMHYGRGVRTRQWVRDWLDRRHDIYQELGFGLWAVVEVQSHEVIGYCGLTYFPDITRSQGSRIAGIVCCWAGILPATALPLRIASSGKREAALSTDFSISIFQTTEGNHGAGPAKTTKET